MKKIEILREWRITADDNVEWQKGFRKVCDELKAANEQVALYKELATLEKQRADKLKGELETAKGNFQSQFEHWKNEANEYQGAIRNYNNLVFEHKDCINEMRLAFAEILEHTTKNYPNNDSWEAINKICQKHLPF
jgi:cytoplasmic iron level regulating protein YaaA (DUF328/UPF0246 family)